MLKFHNFVVSFFFFFCLFAQTPLLLAMVILAVEKGLFISQISSVLEQRTDSLTVGVLLWGNISATIMKMLGSFVKVHVATHNISVCTCQKQ